MRFLVDTHIALWTMLDSKKLGNEARSILSDSSNSFSVSYVSVWEVAIKHRANPGRMPIPARAFAEQCKAAGFSLNAVPIESIFQTEELPYGAELKNCHKDPFDRLLLCHAQCEHLRFLTHDSSLKEYGLPFVIAV